MEIFLDELALADKKQPKHMKFLDQIPKSLTGKTYGRNADGKMGFNTTLYERLELHEDYEGSHKFGKRANSLAV